MLQNFKLYSILWSLLIALCCYFGEGKPVNALDQRYTASAHTCATASTFLLRKVVEVLAIDRLFNGINCTELRGEGNIMTSTVSACQPNTLNDDICPSRRNTKFDQKECLENVMADLQHYKKALLVYSNPTLNSIVKAIDDLVENCFQSPGVTRSPAQHLPDQENTFDKRLEMCKTLKGFHIRAITIVRALGYMAAEGHKK